MSSLNYQMKALSPSLVPFVPLVQQSFSSSALLFLLWFLDSLVHELFDPIVLLFICFWFLDYLLYHRCLIPMFLRFLRLLSA